MKTVYLEVKAVAKILGCSTKTVNNMCRAGQIPFIKVGNERRIPEAALYEALEREAEENRREKNISQENSTGITEKSVRFQILDSKSSVRLG